MQPLNNDFIQTPPCSTAYSLRALWQSANFTQSLLLVVLCNMAGYLSDFDDVDDNFEYDGRPYRSEWAVLQRRVDEVIPLDRFKKTELYTIK